MALKLKLVSTQTLKLAFKSLLIGGVVFGLRDSRFDFGWTVLFLFLFSIFYFRPAIGSKKFLGSVISFFVIIFAWPLNFKEESYLAAASVLIFYLILGVKNLLYLKRESFYNVLHFSLVMGIAGLVLKGFPIIFSFPLFLLLFREFYSADGSASPRRAWLISAVGALITTQSLWVIGLLPLGFALGSALTGLLVFMFHDLNTRHLGGGVSREIILRNATIFIFVAIIILLGARWNLS